MRNVEFQVGSGELRHGLRPAAVIPIPHSALPVPLASLARVDAVGNGERDLLELGGQVDTHQADVLW